MNQKLAFDPTQSILSPLWIFALGILIVNDHFLKAAWSNMLTGKLSDFAGLFLAPVLFALILGVKSKQGLHFCGLLIGAVFSAINLFPSIAILWDRSLSLIYPYATTVDPTDLVALVMIPMGISWFSATQNAPQKKHFYLGRTLAFIGIGASLASTNPQEEQFVALEFSTVSIYNQSNEMHILRIRNLVPGLNLDCNSISKAPENYLNSRFFGEPLEWLLQSGQQIPITSSTDRPCDAVLVESETLPDVIVFWTSDLSEKSFPFDFDIPRSIPADPQTLVIHADYPEGAEDFHEWRYRTECGSRADLCSRETLAEAATIPPGASYFWESDSDIGPLHHLKPSSLDRRRLEATEECAAPTAEVGVFWEDDFPRTERSWVIDVREGLDGCHEILMKDGLTLDDTSFLICVPFETISTLKPSPELPTVLLSFTEESTQTSTFLQIRAVYYDDPEANNFVTLRSIHVTKGGLPSQADFPFIEWPRLDCVPKIQSCGVSLPLDLEIDGQLLKPGQTTVFGEVIRREIHLVRAEFLPVTADLCGTLEQNKIYLETVIITE